MKWESVCTYLAYIYSYSQAMSLNGLFAVRYLCRALLTVHTHTDAYAHIVTYTHTAGTAGTHARTRAHTHTHTERTMAQCERDRAI